MVAEAGPGAGGLLEAGGGHPRAVGYVGERAVAVVAVEAVVAGHREALVHGAVADDEDVEPLGPPDLAVEILSPSTAAKDRDLKLELYRQAGVPDYWIVDPEAHQVTVYHLHAGNLDERGVFTGRVAMANPADVAVDLTQVW